MNGLLSAPWLPYVLGVIYAALWVVFIVLFIRMRRK